MRVLTLLLLVTNLFGSELKCHKKIVKNFFKEMNGMIETESESKVDQVKQLNKGIEVCKKHEKSFSCLDKLSRSLQLSHKIMIKNYLAYCTETLSLKVDEVDNIKKLILYAEPLRVSDFLSNF